MRTTQQKLLEKFEVIAETYGCELIVDKKWGNTGTARFQKVWEFKPVYTIGFDFQDHYLRLCPNNSAWTSFEYDRLDEVIELVTDSVKREAAKHVPA